MNMNTDMNFLATEGIQEEESMQNIEKSNIALVNNNNVNQDNQSDFE